MICAQCGTEYEPVGQHRPAHSEAMCCDVLATKLAERDAEVARLREALQLAADRLDDIAWDAEAMKQSTTEVQEPARLGIETVALQAADSAHRTLKALASTTPSAPAAGRSASDDAPLTESRSPETATSATPEPGDLEAIREAARAWRKIVDPTVVAEIVAWLRNQEMNGGHMALADAIEKKWGGR